MKRLLTTMAIIGAIPIVGYLIATAILADLNSEIKNGMGVEAICSLQKVMANPAFQSACEEVWNIVLLRDASIWAGLASIALMLVYWGASIAAGTKRNFNAFIFPKLIPISQLAIAGLVLVEGAIITYGAYIGEAYLIGRVHYFLIGAVGLGSAIGAFQLIASTATIKKDFSQPAFGKQITQSDEPKLWNFLEEISEKLGSKTPDNVVVGLEPNFYATAATVQLLNEEKIVNGETLYLSLPLLRLFSTEELRAVVGHELGHFRGADTAYSLKFAPVYAGLSQSIEALSDEEGGVTSIAKLPAAAMLSLMLELFSRNERRISQERELEADKAGVDVSSSDALASALGKVAIYAPIWSKIRSENIERLNSGKVSGNLSHIYEDSAKYDISHTGIAEIMEEILATKITHPTDTHPTIFERFKNIGFDSDRLTVETLINVGNSSQGLLENFQEIEEELTLHEHRLMIALGHVSVPDEHEEQKNDALLNAVYTLAATMVGADGKIDPAEITVAEAAGQQMFSDFDGVEFRSCCGNLENLPAFSDVVTILTNPLTNEDKSLIYGYLKEIAMADGELANEEKQLLLHLREEWSLPSM
jgi:Zn-dependent protease with chaperone function